MNSNILNQKIRTKGAAKGLRVKGIILSTPYQGFICSHKLAVLGSPEGGHAANIASLDAGLLGQHVRSLEDRSLSATAVGCGWRPSPHRFHFTAGALGWNPGMRPWDGTLGFRV